MCQKVGKQTMTPDQEQLKRWRPKLAGSMDLQGGSLLDELISRDVITSHQKEVIKVLSKVLLNTSTSMK